MDVMSAILFWLLVWFAVSIPVSLVLAQLLKAASQDLLCEEAARPPEIRRPAYHRSGSEEVPSLPRNRILPLGVSPAASR